MKQSIFPSGTQACLVHGYQNRLKVPQAPTSKAVKMINSVCAALDCRSNSTINARKYPSLKSSRIGQEKNYYTGLGIDVMILLSSKYILHQTHFLLLNAIPVLGCILFHILKTTNCIIFVSVKEVFSKNNVLWNLQCHLHISVINIADSYYFSFAENKCEKILFLLP